MKKTILAVGASVLMLSACSPVKGLNLNNMLLSGTNIKSEQSYLTVKLHLNYNSKTIKDKQYITFLNLLNNLKFEVQTKMQNTKTASLGGFIQVKQGKIPFQLYSDSKGMVLLIDNASKAIRIPVQDDTVANEQMVQTIQSKLLPAVVNDLPNPNHIHVYPNVQYKVHGEKISGHKIHAEVYANEVPNLFMSFLDHLSRDQKGLAETAALINEISKAEGAPMGMTAAELKDSILQFKEQVKEMIPDLKASGALDHRNFLKTDILVDKSMHERKAETVIALNHLPDDTDGLKGITLNMTQERWNLNKKVTAQKINRKKFLSPDASEKEFLSTLDKKHSVLYKVLQSLN